MPKVMRRLCEGFGPDRFRVAGSRLKPLPHQPAGGASPLNFTGVAPTTGPIFARSLT